MFTDTHTKMHRQKYTQSTQKEKASGSVLMVVEALKCTKSSMHRIQYMYLI